MITAISGRVLKGRVLSVDSKVDPAIAITTAAGVTKTTAVTMDGAKVAVSKAVTGAVAGILTTTATPQLRLHRKDLKNGHRSDRRKSRRRDPSLNVPKKGRTEAIAVAGSNRILGIAVVTEELEDALRWAVPTGLPNGILQAMAAEEVAAIGESAG
ncbi:MAG: hypothetical protein ABJQ29_09680 [Luteolibacter sp.]